MKAQLFTLFVLMVSLGFVLTSAGTAQGPEPADVHGPIFDGSRRVEPDAHRPAALSAVPAQTGMDAIQQPVQVATATSNVELVGQIGGAISAVAVEGAYAYVGSGPRLVILNISDPTHPTVVGQTAALPGMVNGVAVAGNPSTGAVLSSSKGSGRRYAYVAASDGLRILDVAHPATPTQVGFYDTPGYAVGVAVAGRYAYVADWEGGLRILDVSHPAAPTQVGFYDTPVGAVDVAVVGRYAYVADYYGGLRILDVTDPAAPIEVGSYAGYVSEVVVAGCYAYIVAGSSLRIIDVSNPATPTEAGFYATSEWAVDVAVVGRYAYLADQYGGLRIVDVGNPAAPTEVGFYAGYASEVVVAGRYAYVADYYGGLRILDVTNPAVPSEVGFYAAPGYASEVMAVGNFAYVAGRGGLRIVDVGHPAAPSEVGSYAMPVSAEAIAVAGNYAYVAAGGGGLHILDVGHPAAPTQVGSYPGSAEAVAVAGRYAYVAAGEGGLHIVDVANPAAPTEVSSYDTPGSALDVAVAGHYAYVAASDGLRILDVANPAAPSEVSSYATPGWAVDVAVAGDPSTALRQSSGQGSGRRYAYVAAGPVRILDVADPAAPSEVGFYDTPGYAVGVAVAGRYAYVAAGNLHILDVAHPATPTQVGFYTTPGSARVVAVAEDYAYVADGAGGLLILRLAPSASASIPTTGGRLTSAFDQTNYTFATGTFTDTVMITHTLRFPGHVPATGNPSTGRRVEPVETSGQALSKEPALSLSRDSGRWLADIDHFFEVTAVYSRTGQPAQPSQPYTVIGQYTEAEKGPAIEDTLALYWWNGAQWVREPTSVVDTTNNTVTATPNHFSLWAVLGETHQMFLPAIWRSQ